MTIPDLLETKDFLFRLRSVDREILEWFRDVIRERDTLRIVLDNMVGHHEATRIGSDSHIRPDRCEFVEQARKLNLKDSDQNILKI